MVASLPTDIVMDVARAADPARFKIAVNKLDSTSDYTKVAKDVALAFNAVDVSGSAPPKAPSVQLPFDVESSRLRLGERSGFAVTDSRDIGTTGGLMSGGRIRGGSSSSYEQFEALTLQQFVEAMFPKQTSSWYGSGFAGDTWKSMLAEQVARELARSGGVGIAKMIEKTHPGEEKAHRMKDLVSPLNDFQKKVISSGEFA